MSIGNSARAWSRRDIVKIARRFNAGLGATTPQVPEGRLNSWHVIRQLQYIQGQEEHHRQMTFQEEFLALLKEHRIEYDDRYLWD